VNPRHKDSLGQSDHRSDAAAASQGSRLLFAASRALAFHSAFSDEKKFDRFAARDPLLIIESGILILRTRARAANVSRLPSSHERMADAAINCQRLTGDKA